LWGSQVAGLVASERRNASLACIRARLITHPAQIYEMRLCGGALGQFGGLPFVDELVRRHCREQCRASSAITLFLCGCGVPTRY
jgi:hypothetical protein